MYLPSLASRHPHSFFGESIIFRLSHLVVVSCFFWCSQRGPPAPLRHHIAACIATAIMPLDNLDPATSSLSTPGNVPVPPTATRPATRQPQKMSPVTLLLLIWGTTSSTLSQLLAVAAFETKHGLRAFAHDHVVITINDNCISFYNYPMLSSFACLLLMPRRRRKKRQARQKNFAP